MEWELFKSIVDECNHYGERSYSLHLFGEPLLHPKILDAIDYIKRKNKNNTILFTTNGTLLNRFIDDLARLKVDKIIWSWRRNNFNDHTRDVLKKIGLVRFLIEETPEGEIEKWEGFQKEIKHLHNYGGNVDVSKLQTMVRPLRQGNRPTPTRYPCYHLWLAPAIRWNGEITRCCDDPHGKASVGIYGIDGLTLASYWNSEGLSKNREAQRRREYLGICKTCDVWQTYPDIFFGWQKHAK